MCAVGLQDMHIAWTCLVMLLGYHLDMTEQGNCRGATIVTWSFDFPESQDKNFMGLEVQKYESVPWCVIYTWFR